MQSMGTAIKKTYPAISVDADGAEDADTAGGDGAADGQGVPEIEICGWECRHAFGLLHDSNLTLLDAFYSPLVYRTFDPTDFTTITMAHPVDVKLPLWVRAVQGLIGRVYDRDKLAWATWYDFGCPLPVCLPACLPASLLLAIWCTFHLWVWHPHFFLPSSGVTWC